MVRTRSRPSATSPRYSACLASIELPLAEGADGVDHAAERVVDLVGDAGGERSGGGEPLGGEQAALGVDDPALGRLDVLLEPAVVVGDLVDHEVERADHAAHLVVGLPFDDLLGEVSLGDAVGGLDEAAQGPQDEAVGEDDGVEQQEGRAEGHHGEDALEREGDLDAGPRGAAHVQPSGEPVALGGLDRQVEAAPAGFGDDFGHRHPKLDLVRDQDALGVPLAGEHHLEATLFTPHDRPSRDQLRQRQFPGELGPRVLRPRRELGGPGADQVAHDPRGEIGAPLLLRRRPRLRVQERLIVSSPKTSSRKTKIDKTILVRSDIAHHPQSRDRVGDSGPLKKEGTPVPRGAFVSSVGRSITRSALFPFSSQLLFVPMPSSSLISGRNSAIDDEADDDAEDHDHDRLEQLISASTSDVHFLVVVVGDLDEHRVEVAGLLADVDHVDDDVVDDAASRASGSAIVSPSRIDSWTVSMALEDDLVAGGFA